MIGDVASLDRLRSHLEAGIKYQTMGHTLLCQKAFPPRWEGDNGQDSRAQAAVNVWIGNDKASVSVEYLRRQLATGCVQTYEPSEDDASKTACVLKDMNTGGFVRGEHRDELQAYLIAILKVLINTHRARDGITCVSCGQSASRRCEVDCGEAVCGSPLCDTCEHVEKSANDVLVAWKHKQVTT